MTIKKAVSTNRIKFVNVDGSDIWINPCFVTHVTKYVNLNTKFTGSSIGLVSGEYLNVRASPVEVCDLLGFEK